MNNNPISQVHSNPDSETLPGPLLPDGTAADVRLSR
jgi:hypothetical protein